MVDEANFSTYADLVKKTASRKLELLAARATLPSRGIIWCYHKVWKNSYGCICRNSPIAIIAAT